ncbi:MAG TPA: GTPase [Nannocystaceae bacterium]|nr:GTPase [Nannocystaceae bacterium]
MTARTTLVGVATGTPDGGVAIVRLSGPDAFAIARKLGVELGPVRKLVLRELSIGEAVLVVAMPGPRSFTGEDVVELHVHAGRRNVESVVRACLSRGAIAAGAGDFTRRAFEHGRLSLDEAEGIAAIIGAQTEAALEQARRLASGELGREVDGLLAALLDLRAEIEAQLDFPEDVAPVDLRRWSDAIAVHSGVLARWVLRFAAGERARARPRIVLAGPPNAGKSSLFNALLGRARAIVAPSPGTTRDYVEAELVIGRHACVAVDTAGLRDVGDAIERAGIERSREQIEGADVVVWLEAADAPASDRPALGVAVELVESKRDRGARRSSWHGVTVMGPRAGEGVEELRAKLRARFDAAIEGAWIGLARHRERAVLAVQELDRARLQLGLGALELVAFHVAAAHDRLAEIRGRSATGPVGEAVLARVFERFCIGK